MNKYVETNLVHGVTADGTYPDAQSDPLLIKGEVILGFYGDLGGATVKIVFETETPNFTLEPLPESEEWTFTEKPGAERYRFSGSLPFRFVVTGATASTNFGVNLHNLAS